jgi:hypothetical protein
MNSAQTERGKADLTISRGTANADVDFRLKKQASNASNTQELNAMTAAMTGALIGAKAAQSTPRE